jgi:hypothetical protein
MAKGKARKKLQTQKTRKKTARYKDGGERSNYALKRAYCVRNECWGFEVPFPKPWKRKG